MQISTIGIVGAPYREGNTLVVPSGSCLPAYCVKCGNPSTELLNHTFKWKAFESNFLIPGSSLAAAFSRGGRVRIGVPYCQTHRSQRSRMSIVATVLLIGFFPMAYLLEVLGINKSMRTSVIVAMLLSGIAIVAFGSGPLRPIDIDRNRARFKGASEQFLSRLPSEPA